MINKRLIIQACIDSQEKNIQEMSDALCKTRESVINAVGSMTSWSDTMRFQQGRIADGLAEKLHEAERSLVYLKSLSIVDCDTICLGSFFILRGSDTGEENCYFVIGSSGGNSFHVESTEIISISIKAPLLQAIIGKKKGDRFTFRGREFRIVDVQ